MVEANMSIVIDTQRQWYWVWIVIFRAPRGPMSPISPQTTSKESANLSGPHNQTEGHVKLTISKFNAFTYIHVICKRSTTLTLTLRYATAAAWFYLSMTSAALALTTYDFDDDHDTIHGQAWRDLATITYINEERGVIFTPIVCLNESWAFGRVQSLLAFAACTVQNLPVSLSDVKTKSWTGRWHLDFIGSKTESKCTSSCSSHLGASVLTRNWHIKTATQHVNPFPIPQELCSVSSEQLLSLTDNHTQRDGAHKSYCVVFIRPLR